MAAAINKNPAVLEACMRDLPIAVRNRSSKSRDDFGDDETIRRHLRRKSKSYPLEATMGDSCNIDEDFGIFAGWQHGRGWVVIIKEAMMNGFTGVETFPTLASLKEEWELD